jgi:orotate phosphoribosyltransferase
MIAKEEASVEICDILIKVGAIKFGTFTLSSGKLSPYYIDLRIIPSFPGAFRRTVEVLKDAAAKVDLKKFQSIAGIPTAGVPYASVLAYTLGKPFLYVRKETKLHGRERRIEGVISPGSNVLIVDDLITTGKSALEAVQAIRSEGGVVTDALVLIDREEGGERSLREVGVKLHSFIKISKIARILFNMGAIDREQYNGIMKQIV